MYLAPLKIAYMCGIAGSVNFKLSYDTVRQLMLHRGPDEQAAYTQDNVDFYHLRLAILDISNGKQPMQLDGRYSIIFNGEIYNHADVRKQFGITGKTSSDTETLLLLYRKAGVGFLDSLDGMFVFAIYDNVEKKLFIARDRAGKKPLYVFNDGKKIVFASELNCIKGLLPLEINPGNFFHYARLGSFYREMTPYRNVKELKAGTFLLIDCNTLDTAEQQWWNIADRYIKTSPDSFEESLEKTNSFLTAAVRRRLESSDLEVGCFLSGGIDSGLTTAIGSQYNNRLKTFTVGFDGAYDESPLAKLVADKYQTDHTEIRISFDNLSNDLEKILYNYGEPFFDSSAIPSYYVSREAAKHLTVIINGDGADELFGGYRRYVPFSKYDFFRKNVAVSGTAKLLNAVLPPGNNKKSKYNYLYRLVSLASKSNLEVYLSAGSDIIEGYEDQIIDPGFDYLEPIRRDFDKIARADVSGLKKIMNMDFDTNLFGDLLVKMDIATMANSLEGRSPFLSRELLEYVPSLPDRYKINGSTTKFLLRELAKKYLPPQLVNQPKRGFEIPLKEWIDGELKQIVFDYVGTPGAFSGQFIKKDFTQKLLAGKVRISGEKRAKILWMMFSMEVWHRKNYLAGRA